MIVALGLGAVQKKRSRWDILAQAALRAAGLVKSTRAAGASARATLDPTAQSIRNLTAAGRKIRAATAPLSFSS